MNWFPSCFKPREKQKTQRKYECQESKAEDESVIISHDLSKHDNPERSIRKSLECQNYDPDKPEFDLEIIRILNESTNSTKQEEQRRNNVHVLLHDTNISRDSPIEKYTYDLKCANVLKEILPERCINNLNNGVNGFTWHHAAIGVLFTDIVGFTAISAVHSISSIVEMLNDMFTRFDNICELTKVFKVETIGDSYMAVSGHSTKNNDPQCWRLFITAVKMLGQVDSMSESNLYPFSIQIRIGLHVGPACSGVIGKVRPRYCFFGDTINMASRMESSSKPGMIMMSASFYEHVRDMMDTLKTTFKVTRKNKSIKGKGSQYCYLVDQIGPVL